jgi:cytochrome b6-f complex iron-sulfur subunit
MTDERKTKTFERRLFLQLAGGAAVVTAVGGLTACGEAGSTPTVVEVPLASIPDGGRLRIVVGEMPVELTNGPEGVRARSLWCTHSGCEVKWQEDRQVYFCACHEGEYDAEGQVIGGPPPRPLPVVPVSAGDGKVRVG